MTVFDFFGALHAWGWAIICIAVAAAVAYGVIIRIVRARRDKKRGGAKEAWRRSAGRAMNMIDPLTGVPRNIVDKAPIIEYIEAHFEEGQNDETGIIGKDKEDF